VGEGIFLFGEGAFDLEEGEIHPSEIPELIEITKTHPISLVSTRENTEEDFNQTVVYIIRRGQMLPLQKGMDSPINDWSDLIHNVSPTNFPVKGLIRVCADGGDEYTGREKADLFLLPHACWLGEGNNHRDIDSFKLAQIHRQSLKKTALIVTSDKGGGAEPIYNLKGEVVSRSKSYNGFDYYEVNMDIALQGSHKVY